jgi:cyclohexanecarboxylate-CoA ligase
MLEGATLWDLIEVRVAATPVAEMAVDESGRRMTFGEYRDRCERVAGALAGRGIGSGDTVTWQLPTWFESMVLVGAIARLGARQNPILHIYREREVGFCVSQTGAKLLVVPTEFAGFEFEKMADGIAAAEGATVEVLTCDRMLPEADPSNLPAPPTEGDEVRWYFYTSGTTAEPKGARHTDQTIEAVAKGMAGRLDLHPTDRVALAFPFPHIGGITWLYTSLMVGHANICFESFIPDQVVEILDKEGVTLAGSGTVFHQTYLAAQRKSAGAIFEHVRSFPGGGAPKPPALFYEMKEAFPGSAGILSGYGLTEAPILTMSGTEDGDEDLANTEGMPMPGVELRLVTLEGKVAASGEEGEVRAKAPQLMLGYLDASLDDDAFDEDGFFRTGDLGTLNERNMLIITGRLKDVIIRKGENVSAKEVEDHLYRHPSVADVAVIGLPDPSSGERVCAVVATKDGAEPIEFDAMVQFLKDEGLMVQKIPEQLEFIEVIPRNPAGKVLKRDLQAAYEGSEATRRS